MSFDRIKEIASLVNGAYKKKQLTFKEAKEIGELPLIIIPDFICDKESDRWSTYVKDFTKEERTDFSDGIVESKYILVSKETEGMVVLIDYGDAVKLDRRTPVHITIVHKDMGVSGFTALYVDDEHTEFVGLVEFLPYLSDRMGFMENMTLGSVLTFVLCLYAKNNRLHTVDVIEDKPTRAVSSTRPVRVSNYRSIIFLDSKESINSYYKGGTHASPIGHQRRSHSKTLTHPRFKNHKDYMKKNAIMIGKTWVGSKVFKQDSKIYTVRD